MGEEGGRSREQITLHPQHPVLPAELYQLLPVGGGKPLPVPFVDLGLRDPLPQTRIRDPQLFGQLSDRTGPLPGQLNRPPAELRWMEVQASLLPSRDHKSPHGMCPEKRGKLRPLNGVQRASTRRPAC